MATLPRPLDAIWQEMEAHRTALFRDVAGLSQAQASWRPGPGDWCIVEILHHLTLAEVATGKLTSKLLKDHADRLPPFPADLAAFRPLPEWPPGPREAPPVVKPTDGQDLAELVAGLRAARERSRQTLERLAAYDPRPMGWRHFTLGELDLGQWWLLQARHEADHGQQLHALRHAPAFPR
jgi:hypothetical protein